MKQYDDILDLLVRHRIYLQRLSAEQSAQIAKMLNKGNRLRGAIIRDHLEDILQMGAFSRKQVAALGRLQTDLAKSLGGTYDEARDWYVKDLDELIKHEVDTASKVVSASLPASQISALTKPSASALNRLTATTPYSGYPIQDWFDGSKQGQLNKIMARVRIGIANGDSQNEIVRAIRGTRESKFTDGIMKHMTTSQANTISRTITNGVSNQAQQEFYDANSRLIAYEIFQATLDGRTSSECAALDGQRFKVGEGPVPPLHPNCRSLRVPVTNAMAEDGQIGDRPFVRDSDTRKEREKRFRKEAHEKAGNDKWKAWSVKQRNQAIARQREAWKKANIGRTGAKTSYQTWLKRQPAWFQKEVLGPTRYQLFKKGGLSLSSFVDHNNQRYTLDQLRKIESAAFRRAGI